MRSPSVKLRRAKPLLGTLVEITASGPEAALQPALDAAFASIERVHRLMSFHASDSDVSRINAAETGSVVSVEADTFRVLTRALELGELSGGVFDIATAGALVEQGFLPAPAGAQRPEPQASFRDLVLMDGHRVQWHRKGWIDLGGIAKGYAVDCAIATLHSHGVDAAVVNAGGDLRCYGRPSRSTCVAPMRRLCWCRSGGSTTWRSRPPAAISPASNAMAGRSIRWSTRAAMRARRGTRASVWWHRTA